MNSDQIETFLTIVSESSFLNASRQLNVAQSTVSERIRQLELEFNTPLFVHNRAGAKLTAAGHRFIPYARNWVSIIEKARRDIELEDKHETL